LKIQAAYGAINSKECQTKTAYLMSARHAHELKHTVPTPRLNGFSVKLNALPFLERVFNVIGLIGHIGLIERVFHDYFKSH
jgi:hypothetical protein